MWFALLTLEAVIRSHLGDADLKTCLTASGGTEFFEVFTFKRTETSIGLSSSDMRGDSRLTNCINNLTVHWNKDGLSDETLAVMLVYDSSRARLGLDVIRDVPVAKGTVSTTLVAGEEGGIGFRDGPAAQARFELPMSIAAKDGLLYVADRENSALRVVDLKRGEVRTQLVFPEWEQRPTYRTSALQHPSSMAFDPKGRLHVLDALQNTIWRVSGDRIEPVFQAEAEELRTSRALVFDADGTALVTDNSRVVRIDLASKKLTKVVDKLKHPEGIALDGKGHLYIAEFDDREIREVTLTTGASRTIGKGTGSLVANGESVFIADSDGTVRKIEPATRKVTTLAKNLAHFSSSGLGEMPFGLTWSDGALYLVESGASVVRKITPTGEVTTVAGSAPAFTWRAIARASDGTIYATAGQALYRLDGPGKQTRIAGHPTAMGHTDGVRDKTRFRGPFGLAALPNGDVIVAEVNGQIRRIEPKRGTVKTIADFDAILDGITTDDDGNIYVGRYRTIVRLDPKGKRSTISKTVDTPLAMVVHDGALYVLDNTRVRGIDSGMATILRKIDLATLTSERLAVWYARRTKSESAPITRGIAVRDGALWISHANRTVTRFDLRSRVERAVVGPPTITATDSLVVTPDGLLISDGGAVLEVSAQ
jgi:sugar lactone lactonase YvrE